MNDDAFEYVEGHGFCLKGTTLTRIDIMKQVVLGGTPREDLLTQNPGLSPDALDACLQHMGAVLGKFSEQQERLEAQSWTELSWEDAQDLIQAKLILPNDAFSLPADAITIDIAGEFNIYCIGVTDPDSEKHVVTQLDIRRWGLEVDEFLDLAFEDTVHSWIWTDNRLSDEEDVEVCQYPERNTGWLDFMIYPQCFLSHHRVKGNHVLFIPTTETALLTGLADIRGQEIMLQRAIELSDGRKPITSRPIWIGDSWTRNEWHPLEDPQNPLAAEYSKAFGTS